MCVKIKNHLVSFFPLFGHGRLHIMYNKLIFCNRYGRLFPEACLVGARLVYFGRWSEPVPQNLGQLCRWAVNYGSCLLPLPFPVPFKHSIVQQTIEKRILKFTQTPKCLVKRFRFHAETKPFLAKQQTMHGKHTKSMNYTTIL